MVKRAKAHELATYPGYFLIEEEVEQIETSRRIRIMTKVFDGWHVYVAGCRPAREERVRKAEEMATRRKNAAMRKILMAFHRMAHGPSSRKAVMSDYKRRYVVVCFVVFPFPCPSPHPTRSDVTAQEKT